MFGHQRKNRVLFVLADLILATLAFEIAYQIRVSQNWHFLFYLTMQQKALILGFSLLGWVTIGFWLGIYDTLDAEPRRTILRDSVRQSIYTALSVLACEYALRMDLSRFFLALYTLLTWTFIVAFRLAAGRIVGVFRRRFGTLHYVLVIGTGERAIRIARMLENSVAHGVRLHGFFSEPGPAPRRIALDSNYPVHPIEELSSVLSKYVVDEIIIAVESGGLA